MRFALLIIITMLVVAPLLSGWLRRTPSPMVARRIRQTLIWFGVIALVLLAATGHLHWLTAVIGGLIALIARSLPLLRYLPLVERLWRQTRGHGQSVVQTRFLRLWVDPRSGNIDGEILEGAHQGQRLQQLERGELEALYDAWRENDPESSALLQTYLQRRYGSTHGTGHTTPARTTLTREEALAVLGLDADASREHIIEAHRRLIQKLHPDRGGSSYLAAKINQAKDLLVGK